MDRFTFACAEGPDQGSILPLEVLGIVLLDKQGPLVFGDAVISTPLC